MLQFYINILYPLLGKVKIKKVQSNNTIKALEIWINSKIIQNI